MEKSESIKPHHLRRKALIYIRQSTPQQQISNQESVRLQYALKERAIALGWQEKDVEVIDGDLGRSGKTTTNREGFKEVLAKLALGEVGIILAWEVTRLSRNCTDLYPLLDLCGYKGCLIGDVDGIYDPATSNGRMILGLKGQISEIELHTIQIRLSAGLENKAERGELAQRLPVGLIRDREGRIHKHPDVEVQGRIELLFDTFVRLGTAHKVMQFFKKNNLLIPRQNKVGDIYWVSPSTGQVIKALKQPAYAGAFARGMRKTVINESAPGKKSVIDVPMGQWRHLVKDKYPKYITWEVYEQIRRKLADNYAEYNRRSSRGVAKEGATMLQGIAYCGECGHKMRIEYKRRNQYSCKALEEKYGLRPCPAIPGDPVDAVVINAFLEAVSPIELDAYKKALDKQREMEGKIAQAQQEQIERLEYREQLAKRQYDHVDPANRLVASELEKRWEQALWELKKAREEDAKRKEKKQLLVLTPELEKLFRNIGKNLPEIWKSNLLSSAKKKELLRALIDKVVLQRIVADKVKIRIVWKGGESSSFIIPVNVLSFNRLSSAKEMEEIIRAWVQADKSDQEIAEHLTSLGYRSPRNDSVLINTVERIRRNCGLFRREAEPLRRHIPGYLTVSQLGKIIGVSEPWIYYQIRKGTMIVKKELTTGLYLFPDTPHTIKKVRKFRDGKIEKLRFS